MDESISDMNTYHAIQALIKVKKMIIHQQRMLQVGLIVLSIH